jgi:hypothetical protein
MKTFLLVLALALTAQAQIILRPGDSANLPTDPPNFQPMGIGSLGWTRDPLKDTSWIQVSGATDFAYVVRDTTGLVVEPMDDFVQPFSGGLMWQEGADLPEQVWLRVYLSDERLLPGAPMGAYAMRSVRFGFDRPGAGPFEVPEPGHLALLAAVGLAGLACYRWLR